MDEPESKRDPAGTDAGLRKGPKSVPESGSSSAPESVPLARRQFFERLGWIGMAILAVFTVPSTLRFLMPRRAGAGRTEFDAGSVQDYAATTVSTRWIRRHGVWVVRDHAGLFALQADCPHLGCTPRWEPQSSRFRCPCHGSLFSLEGIALRGPAREPLKRVSIRRQGERILIDPADYVSLEDAESRGGYHVMI